MALPVKPGIHFFYFSLFLITCFYSCFVLYLKLKSLFKHKCLPLKKSKYRTKDKIRQDWTRSTEEISPIRTKNQN